MCLPLFALCLSDHLQVPVFVDCCTNAQPAQPRQAQLLASSEPNRMSQFNLSKLHVGLELIVVSIVVVVGVVSGNEPQRFHSTSRSLNRTHAKPHACNLVTQISGIINAHNHTTAVRELEPIVRPSNGHRQRCQKPYGPIPMPSPASITNYPNPNYKTESLQTAARL